MSRPFIRLATLIVLASIGSPCLAVGKEKLLHQSTCQADPPIDSARKAICAAGKGYAAVSCVFKDEHVVTKNLEQAWAVEISDKTGHCSTVTIVVCRATGSIVYDPEHDECGMATKALGDGTLGMSCRNIEKLETETGGKVSGLGASRSQNGKFVGHSFYSTRYGYPTFASYTCDTAKSVVVSMRVQYLEFRENQKPLDRAQVARMEVESAKRAGYKVCREFEEPSREADPPGDDFIEMIHFSQSTVVLRKGSREYVVERNPVCFGSCPAVMVSVGTKAHTTVHCK
jgi:hypothetical protein